MATALDGASELAQLAQAVPAHLSILPASGISATTLPRLLNIADLNEAHLSAGGIYTPPSDPAGARGEVLGFGRSEWRLDAGKLQAVRDWVDENT
jgi:copper homeostasis protein CutC